MSSPAAKKSRFSPATVQLPSQPLPPSAALGSPPGTSTGISSLQNQACEYDSPFEKKQLPGFCDLLHLTSFFYFRYLGDCSAVISEDWWKRK